MQCIYGIKNRLDNKIYVGQTRSLKKRWPTHLSYLKNNKHSNPHLQNAWNKYGEESFDLVVLEIVDDPELLTTKEQGWMDRLRSQDPDTGYNIESASSGKSRPMMFSDEHKRKISESKKGKPRSPETVEKMRQAATGRTWTDAQRKAMEGRFSGTGNPFSKLDWEKVAYIRSEHSRGRTITDIGKELSLHPSTIGLVVNNKTWIEP